MAPDDHLAGIDDIIRWKSLAAEQIDLSDGSMVMRFPTVSDKSLGTRDPIWSLTEYLKNSGPKGNVFRISSENRVMWRIADTKRRSVGGLLDGFVSIELQGEQLFGWTYDGWKYLIDIDNGTLTELSWEK